MFYTKWTDDEGVAYAHMLFDHSTDPIELENLAEKDKHKNRAAQMAEELRQKWGKDFLR